MAKITFQVNYDFFKGAMGLPKEAQIVDVRRSAKAGMFDVDAVVADEIQGNVEPIYARVEYPLLFFQRWEKK